MYRFAIRFFFQPLPLLPEQFAATMKPFRETVLDRSLAGVALFDRRCFKLSMFVFKLRIASDERDDFVFSRR